MGTRFWLHSRPRDAPYLKHSQATAGGGYVQMNPGVEYSVNSHVCAGERSERSLPIFFFELQRNTQCEERRRPMSNENSPAV